MAEVGRWLRLPRHVLVKDSQMTKTQRLAAEPIMRILCGITGSLVGYLYQWNNGDVQPAWLNDAKENVRYEPMVKAADPA
jgi:hypothetical protein